MFSGSGGVVFRLGFGVVLGVGGWVSGISSLGFGCSFLRGAIVLLWVALVVLVFSCDLVFAWGGVV